MISEKAMNQEPRVVDPPASPEPLLPSFPSVETCSRFPLRSLRAPVEGFPTFCVNWCYLVQFGALWS